MEGLGGPLREILGKHPSKLGPAMSKCFELSNSVSASVVRFQLGSGQNLNPHDLTKRKFRLDCLGFSTQDIFQHTQNVVRKNRIWSLSCDTAFGALKTIVSLLVLSLSFHFSISPQTSANWPNFM